jgi:HlyD family secretion protein
MPSRASPRIARANLGILVMVGAALSLTGCRPSAEFAGYQGYLEAEYLYLASPFGGNLSELRVQRGEEVQAGQVLFRLDPEPETLALTVARHGLDQAAARLADLQKGRRPPEIESTQARLGQNGASLRLAEIEWSRIENLRREDIASQDELYRARSNLEYFSAQKQQLTAELETAKLAARPDEIRGAEAGVEAARTGVERAEWALAQKTVVAPVASVVHDTLYRPGEWVAPGNPVAVLLPPANIKVRFFVPQKDLSLMRSGAVVRVAFDGQAQPLEARVSYVATQAEFTPPVIYSQQARAKLVFMVEARIAPESAAGLRPGQPVDVAPGFLEP